MIFRPNSSPAALVALVAAFALILVSCGDGGSPAVPTPPAAPSQPPSTTPPSSGGSNAGASACPLGEGSRTASCDRTFSELDGYVEAAINQLVEEQPQIFDLAIEKGDSTGQYLVLLKEEYIDGVVDNLRGMGLCAGRSIIDYEVVQVKIENDYSEDYDIYTAEGFIRRGGGSYRQTCTPASFPVARDPNAPPQGSGCGLPYPPPVSRIKVKLHLVGGEYDTLDATPLVGHDAAYCAAIGYTDGRSLCAVRQEGDPEREACEEWLVGKAEDTGRVGPTWTNTEGQFCTGPASGCTNADNQYSLWVNLSGKYTACATNGACGWAEVFR